MNIVLCDDDKDYLDKLNCLIEGVLIKNKFASEIVLSTSNPYDVLLYIQQENPISIYFLDISFGGKLTGIELARLIRQKDYTSTIVFITDYPNNMSLTYEYKLKIYDFIVKSEKNLCKKKIEKCIIHTEKRQQKGYSHCINVYNNKNSFSIPYTNIYYIDTISGSHKLVIHTRDSIYQFYGTIKTVLKNLDNRFVQCHKSIIVNKDMIIGANKKTKLIILLNGYTCSYSKRFFNPDTLIR